MKRKKAREAPKTSSDVKTMRRRKFEPLRLRSGAPGGNAERSRILPPSKEEESLSLSIGKEKDSVR